MSEDFHRLPVSRFFFHPEEDPMQRPVIGKSTEAFRLFLGNWDLHTIYAQEEMKILYLDCRNGVICIDHHSAGGMNCTVVCVKRIIKGAIDFMAASIIMAHNHPSGKVSPSQADIELTTRIKWAAELFDVRLSDHLVISPVTFFSMADNAII